MALPGEKNISAFADPEVSAEFKQQCEDRRYFKNAALEGAIRSWLTLDRVTQGELIEGKVKPEFSADPKENEIFQDLDDLARKFASVNEKIRRSEAAKQRKSRKRKVAQ